MKSGFMSYSTCSRLIKVEGWGLVHLPLICTPLGHVTLVDEGVGRAQPP